MTRQIAKDVVFDIECKASELQKHALKYETILEEVLRRTMKKKIDLHSGDTEVQHVIDVGLQQIIVSQTLHPLGYRSVRDGYYVKMMKSDNALYLLAMKTHNDLDVEERRAVGERIKELLRTKCDGQMIWKFDADGNPISIINPPTEEEFMTELELDAF